MAEKHWSVDELPWDRLDRSKVNTDLLKIVKAAALVEYNATDYTHYLCNVFHDDPQFQDEAHEWEREEVQHGVALGRWATKIEPTFDLEETFARFRSGYRLPHLNAQESIRGSRSGEMVARCMVEIGTSSYYTAIAEAIEEPVLKIICRHIAADELRHYKLFYTHMKRYIGTERVSRFHRLKIAVGRIIETTDDELAYAYYAANVPADKTYDRARDNDAYTLRAYRFYRRRHVDRGIAMLFKACGLKPYSTACTAASGFAWWVMQSRSRRLARSQAVAVS